MHDFSTILIWISITAIPYEHLKRSSSHTLKSKLSSGITELTFLADHFNVFSELEVAFLAIVYFQLMYKILFTVTAPVWCQL